MAGRQAGRRTKRTATVEKKIVAALKAGNTRANAARLAGISYPTLKRWCQLSEPFRAALDLAEAEAEGAYVADIKRMAKGGNFQAASFWLKTRRHDDWREPAERHEHTGKDGGPITLTDLFARARANREERERGDGRGEAD